jgi:hypothetical protein
MTFPRGTICFSEKLIFNFRGTRRIQEMRVFRGQVAFFEFSADLHHAVCLAASAQQPIFVSILRRPGIQLFATSGSASCQWIALCFGGFYCIRLPEIPNRERALQALRIKRNASI